MKYKTDKNKRPIYLQIYIQLKRDIINGVYAFGTKLPSKRLLSSETGTSTVTVEHAYDLLCEEGYIEPRERSGYFVIFKKTDGFAIAPDNLSRRDCAPHRQGDYPDFPFSVFSKTMRAVLSEQGDKVFEKSLNKGCPELRLAVARYLAKNRGINADIEQIVIGSGAEYLYGLITQLLGRNRIYGFEYPSYKKIEQVYKAAQVSCRALALSNDGIDGKALALTDADVLHTTPYRSFPSGVTATASKRHEYILWASAKERYIIEDDFESEFSVLSKPVDTLFSISQGDNVIYLNSFSKTVSPALRMAYMVLPQKLAAEFDKRLGFYSCTVPTFEQLVLARLFENGDFERHINRVRRYKRKNISVPAQT